MAKRILIATNIGLISGLYCYVRLILRGALAADFTWAWRAAQAVLSGLDPYAVVQASGAYPFDAPFYYPLPAALFAIPFSALDPYLAGALFFGLSSALLAWALTRGPAWRLLLFLSPCFWIAARLAQWAPLVTAAALLLPAAPLAVLKPNIGVAAMAYRPTARKVALCVALLAASLLILPSWPGKWLANTSQHGNFVPALVLPFGPLLLLAVLRCRCPRGRLLLTMSAVPQRFYDPLLLWLIPRTPWQSLLLSVLGWVAHRFLLSTGLWGSLTPAMEQAAILALYLPALGFTLLRWR